jgi:hypothetical protein
MDEAETERYTRTLTKREEDDEELLDLYRPRPTNITPSRSQSRIQIQARAQVKTGWRHEPGLPGDGYCLSFE